MWGWECLAGSDGVFLEVVVSGVFLCDLYVFSANLMLFSLFCFSSPSCLVVMVFGASRRLPRIVFVSCDHLYFGSSF